jgi:hypothetical protein
MKPWILVFALCSLVSVTSLAANPVSADLLPKDFAGWHKSVPPDVSHDPGAADPVNALLLKEFGFTDYEAATFSRDDGRKLKLRAARFQDASGALGAFTFYLSPEMLPEKIGNQGASLNQRVLFFAGNIVVDAVFDRLSAMSAAELRELAGDLPKPAESARNLPSLPSYLPRQALIKNSTKYIVGPVGLQKVNAPLPASLVDFSRGAEVALAQYPGSLGDATLMLVSYPTPQIAADRLRQIDAAHPQGTQQQPGMASIVDVGPFFDKRTGPIIAIAAGPLSSSEASTLLSQVNYDAQVTWNENTYATKKDNLANLLVNIILLCGILIGLALVAGVAFGGIRVLLKRLLPDRVFDRRQATEFISLHLAEPTEQAPDSKLSSSIKAS